MPKLALRDLEPWLKAHKCKQGLFILHGPNEALRSDLKKQIHRAYGIADKDAFQSISLDAATLESDPGRLADELGAISMFGDTRIIEARPAAKRAAALIDLARRLPRTDCILIISADQILDEAALTQSDSEMIIIACPEENTTDLQGFAQTELASRQLILSGCSVSEFLALIPPDRLAVRNEVEKLEMYLGGGGKITSEILRSVVADASEFDMERLIAAAFSGDRTTLAAALDHFRLSGGDYAAAVFGAAWRCHSLYRAKVQNWSSGLQKNWREEALRHLSRSLAEASRIIRLDARIAHQIAERIFLEINQLARAQKR